MNVLVVGGAGKVASILRPALEEAHTCRYFDRRVVACDPGRWIRGDLTGEGIADALEGQDAVIFLARGGQCDTPTAAPEIEASFDVNLRAWYKVLSLGLEKGVRRWIYASSLSVYRDFLAGRLDEDVPPDAWRPYGLSKRLAENVCQAAAQAYPDATLVVLRLMLPRSDEEWETLRRLPPGDREPSTFAAQAPADLRRLFLAALACGVPGAHIVQTTGDRRGTRLPNDRATALLGWSPRESLGE